MAERCLTFDCQGDTLVGILHEPEGAPRDVGVLIVVGGPQYRVGSHRQFVIMARRLAAEGYPVFRFDYRGMGDGAGELRAFDTINDDIRAAVDAFCCEWPSLRGVVVFGLCDAASAALLYCQTDARVTGLVLANPWVNTDSGQARALVRHYYLARLFERSFWSKVRAGDFRPARSFLGLVALVRRSIGGGSVDVTDSRPGFLVGMERSFAAFNGPVLLLISGRDLTARQFEDLCQANPVWERSARRRNVQKVGLDDADHTFSSITSLERACSATVGWLQGRVRELQCRSVRAGSSVGK